MAFENAPDRLRLRILLDGTTKAQATTAVAAMRKAYEQLDIEIVPSYRKVSFTGTDAKALLEQAKAHYGGKTPRGVDIVYTLTDKDIEGGFPAGKNVAGLADCIGGIRFPDRAFAVGEADSPRPDSAKLLPPVLPPLADGTGKTMAHEVGHLLGAHHHYASPEGMSGHGTELFTLMGPSLSIITLRFSTVNSAMVRGHMELRAARHPHSATPD